jgi:NAD(P)-dependent dehydrogenase (short-subunit alcohol dehydrogenase family)
MQFDSAPNAGRTVGARRAADARGALNPRITDWRDRRVWLVGASSGIGEALALALAARGARLALSARRASVLESLAERLAGPVVVLPADVADPQALAGACQSLVQRWGEIDLVIWLAGDYREMRVESFDLAQARRMVEVNLLSVFNGLDALLPVFERQGFGGLALVSSVAGYRGLPKALAYGPGKAGLINLAETLHIELSPRGIGVWLIDPGFVATPLTAQNAFRMPGLISADTAADEIVAGFARGGFEMHFPKRFTRWMKLLRILPERLYFRAVRAITGG